MRLGKPVVHVEGRTTCTFECQYEEFKKENDLLRNAIKVQANAIRVLHDAEMSELNHLRKNAQEAYTAKVTLDSEREANKILTDEIERLREALRSLIQLNDNYSFFGGELYQDRIEKTWDKARAALKEKE